MTENEYFWVKNDSEVDHPGVEQSHRTPGWDIGIFYEAGSSVIDRTGMPFDSFQLPLEFEHGWVGSRPDFVWFNPTVLTCSAEVFDAFSSIIFEQCVSFPLLISGERYFAFRPRLFYDLLDEDRSEFRVAKSGTFHNFRKICLRKSPENGVNIFGFLQGEVAKRYVLVSRSFLDVYNANRFTGLHFELCYPCGKL